MDGAADRLLTFFRFAFEGCNAGAWICIARRPAGEKVFIEDYFRYPDDLAPLLVPHVERFTVANDLWFCPNPLAHRQRNKDRIENCPTLWADLDSCHPDRLLVRPSLVIESSPGRYQGLWRLKEPIEPTDAEELSKRIAYHHAHEGADKSGWDLTQLLRVPYTFNQKYREGKSGPPQVKILEANPEPYTVSDFTQYPELPTVSGSSNGTIPFPEALPTPDEVLLTHGKDLGPSTYSLYLTQPTGDWSKALWKLELDLFEAGLSMPEVFVLAKNSACNKYERDNRSDDTLWKEVCKAFIASQQHLDEVGLLRAPGYVKDLLSPEDMRAVEASPTIVEEYIEWAKSLGDAAWQYHQAGIFVILSSLLCGNVRLPTSFGNLYLNLWFMLLADTTLTRKSTAMDAAMDILLEIEADAIMATDGSVEGLLQQLSTRPRKPSVFLRDEIAGLLAMMKGKDYLSGLEESLAKLYDGRMQKRVLRKETIEVRDPRLILFTAGVKTRVMELLTKDHVYTGFVPRFIFITAEIDVSKVRPVGPPTVPMTKNRDKLIAKLAAIKLFYKAPQTIIIEGKAFTQERDLAAELSPDAWALYNQYEKQLLSDAQSSPNRDELVPVYDRLAKSGLKAAVLIAAANREDAKLTVQVEEIHRAFYYVQDWRRYAAEVIESLGKSPFERMVARSVMAITKNSGMTRSAIMNMFHLDSRSGENLISTLEQRNLVIRTRSGKSERLYPR